MKDLISIVIPAYNEEEVVPKLCSRLTNVIDSLPHFKFEVIIVENGSTDNTLELLLKERKKDSRIKVLQLAKNESCDGGIIAGLTFAKGDAAIVMMADLQDIPELIPKFIEEWKKGYDNVYGIVKKRAGVPITRRIGTHIFYRIIDFLTKGSVPQNVSDFRLMDKKVYKEIVLMSEHNKFFRGLVMWTGYSHVGIPFNRSKRYAGKSKAHFLVVCQVALNGIISFSGFPLRMSWIFSVLLLISSIFMLLFNVFTMSIILFVLTFFSIMLAIQGEYIARIFDEVRNRPNFIVSKTYGLDSSEEKSV